MNKPQPGISLGAMLEQISTYYFIVFFLHIKYQGKKTKWYPHPEQKIMLDKMDEAALVKNSTFWLMKSRQAAGTTMVGARLIKKAMAINDYQILVMSKSGPQAEKFLSNRIVKTLEWLYEYAPEFPWPSYTKTASKVTFSNGSCIEAINSSLHAGRGDTVDEVVLDEAAAGEFRYHFDDIWGSITGTTEHSANGFKIVLSTAEPGTTFNAKSKEFYKNPVKGIFFHFMGRYAIPEHMRTQEWWLQRVSELGQVRALLEYPINIDDCFTSFEGFVFPQFNKPENRHVKILPIDFSKIFGVTYDHGRTKAHPAVIWYWLFDKYKNLLYVFQEHYWFEPIGGLPEICTGINEDMAALRKIGAPKPQRCIADTAITNDDGRQSIRDVIFEECKIYFNPSHKYDEKQSLDFLIKRVNENNIVFHPSCVHSIRQYSELMWDDKKDRYGKAKDLDNDAVDVGRYCDADLRKVYPQKEEKLIPPRYTKARKEWVEKRSIHNIGKPDSTKYDWMGE